MTDHLDLTQKIGTVLGGVLGPLFGPALMTVVINTAVGAVVGFIITTLCRYALKLIKQKFHERKLRKLAGQDSKGRLPSDGQAP